jgi:hypothetical protein
MGNRNYQFNRYGEKDVRPGHFQHIRERNTPEKTLPPYHWSNDPRSEHFDEEVKSHYGKGPKGWRISDETIKEEAADRLYRSWDVDASGIEVNVLDGVITLSGTVTDREQKQSAERLFDTMNGVHDVINQIKIEQSIYGWVPGLGEVDLEK